MLLCDHSLAVVTGVSLGTTARRNQPRLGYILLAPKGKLAYLRLAHKGVFGDHKMIG
jgi:hypothetical protein